MSASADEGDFACTYCTRRNFTGTHLTQDMMIPIDASVDVRIYEIYSVRWKRGKFVNEVGNFERIDIQSKIFVVFSPPFEFLRIAAYTVLVNHQ